MFTYKFILLSIATLIILTFLFSQIKIDSFYSETQDSDIEFIDIDDPNQSNIGSRLPILLNVRTSVIESDSVLVNDSCESSFFLGQDPRDDIMRHEDVEYDEDYSEQIGNAAVLNDSHCLDSKKFWIR